MFEPTSCSRTCFLIDLIAHINNHDTNFNISTTVYKNQSTITNPLGYASFVRIQLRTAIRLIPSIRIFQRFLIVCVINCCWMRVVDIEPTRCMWLGSYLSGKIQKIRIDDAVSKDIKVTSGVPQGIH
jgi:hypothetical protein